MFQVKKILKLKVQIVFLSSTLPLHLEKALREEFLLNDLSVIKGSTTKANIVYKSKQYSSSREQEQFLKIREYIKAYYSKFSSLEDKVLIFCLTIPKVKSLSGFLECSFYYTTIDNKEVVLMSYLTSNKDKILVSSSSLQEGIDYPCIRLVVYIDFTHSFIRFLQGSSKGKRNNKKSTLMFFYLRGKELDKELDRSNIDKRFIRQYLREQVCKHKVIKEYLNNNIVKQCFSNVSKCNLCSLRFSIQEATISNILGFNKEV
jgi:superfamily II DNA helicase RecQ